MPAPRQQHSATSCRDGVGCKRFGCYFQHPPQRRGDCRYGTTCHRADCRFLHPLERAATAEGSLVPRPAFTRADEIRITTWETSSDGITRTRTTAVTPGTSNASATPEDLGDTCRHRFRCQWGMKCGFSHTDEEKEFFAAHHGASPRPYKLILCNFFGSKKCKHMKNSPFCLYAHGVTDAWCTKCKLSGHLQSSCGNDPVGSCTPDELVPRYCDQEAATARSERLPVIGVMEVDELYNKADLAEEKHRESTGGANGGPISPRAEDILALLDGPNPALLPLKPNSLPTPSPAPRLPDVIALPPTPTPPPPPEPLIDPKFEDRDSPEPRTVLVQTSANVDERKIRWFFNTCGPIEAVTFLPPASGVPGLPTTTVCHLLFHRQVSAAQAVGMTYAPHSFMSICACRHAKYHGGLQWGEV